MDEIRDEIQLKKEGSQLKKIPTGEWNFD